MSTTNGIICKAQGHDTVWTTAEDLDLGRGVSVSLNGHVYVWADGTLDFTREGERRSYGNPHASRGLGAPDLSPAARQRLEGIVLDAVRTFLAEQPDALREAAAARSASEAADRREEIAKLGALVAQLEREALELERGGHFVYREHNHSSGFSDTVRHVETVDGEILPSIPEVHVSGAHKYGPRMPTTREDADREREAYRARIAAKRERGGSRFAA